MFLINQTATPVTVGDRISGMEVIAIQPDFLVCIVVDNHTPCVKFINSFGQVCSVNERGLLTVISTTSLFDGRFNRYNFQFVITERGEVEVGDNLNITGAEHPVTVVGVMSTLAGKLEHRRNLGSSDVLMCMTHNGKVLTFVRSNRSQCRMATLSEAVYVQ